MQVGDTADCRKSPGHSSENSDGWRASIKPGLPHLDQGLAFCPAEALPVGESELSAAVFLKAGVAAETIVAEYRRSMPTATFAAWPEFMPDLKQLIDLEYICMAIVIILVFAIVAVGISCTFLIFTLKNLREHGIMKAMGFLSGDTALLLVGADWYADLCCGNFRCPGGYA